MRCALFIALICVVSGCGWPSTRMEPAADYASRSRPQVSSAPAYMAGTDYRLTYSPDGSTAFVCADGTIDAAWRVMPGASPAC